MIEPFDFLIGDWELEYKIPKSKYSEAMTGSGSGTFSRKLDDKYVFFDYKARVGDSPEGQAHAVFAWDAKIDLYRFWWFESSGSFMTATCNFINDDTLFINWHNSLLIQTFQKVAPDKVSLRMQDPNDVGQYETVMEVLLIRK